MSTPFSKRFRRPASTRVQRSPGIGKQSPSRAMVTLGPLLYGKLKNDGQADRALYDPRIRSPAYFQARLMASIRGSDLNFKRARFRKGDTMPVPTKMRRRGSADNRRNVWRRLALAAASMGVYRANRFSMSTLPGDFFGASERRGHSLRTIAPHSRHTGARTAPIARSALRADVHCFQRPVRAWSSHGQPIAIRQTLHTPFSL